MLNIIFHILLAYGLLWYQRKLKFKPHLATLAIFWYGIGSLLIFVETAILTKKLFSGFFVQGLIIESFYVLPIVLALKYGRRHPRDLWHPLFLFLLFSLVATVAAGWFLANANVASGLSGLEY